MIASVGAVVGEAHDTLPVDDERAGQHPDVPFRLALTIAAGERTHAGRHHTGVQQFLHSRLLQSIDAIGCIGFVGQTVDAGCEFAAVTLRVLRFAHADRDDLQSCLCQFCLMLLQLSQPLTAEYSAKVPQEGQQGGTVLPQVAQPRWGIIRGAEFIIGSGVAGVEPSDFRISHLMSFSAGTDFVRVEADYNMVNIKCNDIV